MNICEAYAKKLAISEKVYAKEHGGSTLSENKRIAIARVLANTSEYLNEAFDNSVGTQLQNMKTFKKFCLDLTTVALPNLIANDLVIVYPMKSRSGWIQYLQFTAGSNKGGVVQGEVFNDPFKLGAMTEERIGYTSALVNETAAADATTAWTPVGGKVKIWNETSSAWEEKEVADIKKDDKISYVYDIVKIPQNDLPILNAHMEGIELHAKARRIAVYYSQMAAFQAKTEMGIDLGEVLASQACAELSYEIDSEVVKTLVEGAGEPLTDLTFNKHLPVGVGIRDHYAGFAEVVYRASQHIYDATQKHSANYMICASDVLPVLQIVEGFKPASRAKINGPFYAGELMGIKVYVSPAISKGKFVLGFNGDDLVTSAAVFAPYMAIVPTQLLGFADGAMSQGFSTLYDLKLLNKGLLVAGKIVDEVTTADTTHAVVNG